MLITRDDTTRATLHSLGPYWDVYFTTEMHLTNVLMQHYCTCIMWMSVLLLNTNLTVKAGTQDLICTKVCSDTAQREFQRLHRKSVDKSKERQIHTEWDKWPKLRWWHIFYCKALDNLEICTIHPQRENLWGLRNIQSSYMTAMAVEKKTDFSFRCIWTHLKDVR